MSPRDRADRQREIDAAQVAILEADEHDGPCECLRCIEEHDERERARYERMHGDGFDPRHDAWRAGQ